MSDEELPEYVRAAVRKYGVAQYLAGGACVHPDDVRHALVDLDSAIRRYGRERWNAAVEAATAKAVETILKRAS